MPSKQISINIQGRSSNLEIRNKDNYIKYFTVGLAFLVCATSCAVFSGSIETGSGGISSYVSKRRLADATSSQSNLTPVFTQQAFTTGSSAGAVESDQTVGMFFYVKNNIGEYESYDQTFKRYATIEYKVIKGSSSGATISTGQISQCSPAKYAQFLDEPELSGVPVSMLFCPPIDFAREIQTGDVEITLSACNSASASASGVTCASSYRIGKFLEVRVFTTGVFHNRLVVDNGAYKFVPEVAITNKFTVGAGQAIIQDSLIVRNDWGTKSFFTFDVSYPYYALAPDTAQPDLLFTQYYRIATMGQKHILSYVVDSANFTPLSSQVAANTANITALGKPTTQSSRPSHPAVESAAPSASLTAGTAPTLGPSDGKFFMVTLNNKESFNGLSYYAEMQLGTRDPTSTTQYHGANRPMNVTYEAGKVAGSLDAASTQLMSLSTQTYATQVILKACMVAKSCTLECPYVTAFTTSASSTCTKTSTSTAPYTFAQYSPAIDVLSEQFEDTAAFPFTPHEQISILKDFKFLGIAGSLTSSGAANVYAEKFNGLIGLAPKDTTKAGHNFLTQAQANGDITNLMFSIFLDKTSPYLSSVTFGSYDTEGVDPKKHMSVAYSETQDSFEIALKSVAVNTVSVPGFSSKSVLMDPQEALITVSAHDWTKLQASLKVFYPKLLCQPSANARLPDCYFDTECSSVAFGPNNIEINLALQANADLQAITFPMANLFIDAKILDPNTANSYCYAAFQANTKNPGSTAMILGNIFFENYYVVFDMTEAATDSQAMYRIGYGPINPRNVIGDSVYDTDSTHFVRALYDQSTSFVYTLVYPPKTPGTDPADNNTKTGDSHSTHKAVFGALLTIAVIFGFTFCVTYFYPNTCKKQRGQSAAFDEDAIHQLSKQKMINSIKGNKDLMSSQQDELF